MIELNGKWSREIRFLDDDKNYLKEDVVIVDDMLTATNTVYAELHPSSILYTETVVNKLGAIDPEKLKVGASVDYATQKWGILPSSEKGIEILKHNITWTNLAWLIGVETQLEWNPEPATGVIKLDNGILYLGELDYHKEV